MSWPSLATLHAQHSAAYSSHGANMSHVGHVSLGERGGLLDDTGACLYVPFSEGPRERKDRHFFRSLLPQPKALLLEPEAFLCRTGERPTYFWATGPLRS